MPRRWSDFRSPIRRTRDGRFHVDLDPEFRASLGQLLDQLRDLLSTDSSALTRLFPPPYGDDAERNAGYAVLAGAELVEGRLRSIEVVEATLEETSLDEEQMWAWMRSLNDLRLVLGTLLEVDETTQQPSADSEHAAMYGMYEYLGAVLELVVRALDH